MMKKSLLPFHARKPKLVFDAKAKEKGLASIRYQALKAMRKEAKAVKGFLIRKCARRISTLKESGDSEALLQTELELLQQIKLVNHVSMGDLIFETHLNVMAATAFPSQQTGELKTETNPLTNSSATTTTCEGFLKQFVSNKRIGSLMATWRTKFDTVNSQPVAKPKNVTSKDSSKRRHIGVTERTKAIFLDSLEDAHEEEEEERQVYKKERSKKAQQQSSEKTDLTIYMSAEQRYAVQSKANQSVQSRRSERTRYTQRDTTTHSQYSVRRNRTESAPEGEEKLHPSWLAKKKQKEKQVTIPSVGQTQGKKIVFD